jgi:uncharacterized protein YbjT (DUF2867 family)
MDNLLAASEKAGVEHFVILSIIGVDQVPGLDYYRVKVLEENILKAMPILSPKSPQAACRCRKFDEGM